MNRIISRNHESITIQLLALDDKIIDSDSEQDLVIPTFFIPFASKHRWYSHRGSAVTPDIQKTRLFNLSFVNAQLFFVSFNELLAWYEDLQSIDRSLVDTATKPHPTYLIQ